MRDVEVLGIIDHGATIPHAFDPIGALAAPPSGLPSEGIHPPYGAPHAQPIPHGLRRPGAVQGPTPAYTPRVPLTRPYRVDDTLETG